MYVRCLLGRHKPSSASIARDKQGQYKAFCERCDLPIEMDHKGAWRVPPPIYDRPQEKDSVAADD
jgi:hypothetical protein